MTKILVNPEALSPSYLPDKLLYREKEYSQLINNIKNRVNTLVFGSIGSGKTSLVKLAINELKSDVIYVNCLLCSTEYSILKETLPPSRFIVYRSTFELLKELRKIASERKLVICLDNFTQLRDVNVVKKMIELSICVILVGRVERDSPSLNRNVLSNFPCVIRLEEYSVDQTFEILKKRARLALESSSYTDLPLRRIAEKIGGNITMALAVLRAIALKAENEGKTIDEVSLEEMLPQIDFLDELGNDERTIYKILSEWKSLPSSRLYALYVQTAKYPRCERSFRKYMENLRSRGLVKAIGGRKGRIYEIVENNRNEDPKSNGEKL